MCLFKQENINISFNANVNYKRYEIKLASRNDILRLDYRFRYDILPNHRNLRNIR